MDPSRIILLAIDHLTAEWEGLFLYVDSVEVTGLGTYAERWFVTFTGQFRHSWWSVRVWVDVNGRTGYVKPDESMLIEVVVREDDE